MSRSPENGQLVDNVQARRNVEIRYPEEYEEGYDIGEAVYAELGISGLVEGRAHALLAAMDLAFDYADETGRGGSLERHAIITGAQEAAFDITYGGEK